jgi:uncharacterized repeat protein (TIGR01451 family)
MFAVAFADHAAPRGHSLLIAALICGILATANIANALPVADLSLTSTVSDSAPVIGTEVTFHVTLSNAGPNAVARVSVRDRLPDGYRHVGWSAPAGTYNPVSGQWIGVRAAAHGSVTLTLVARVNPSGNYTTAAEVTFSPVTDPDSIPGNGNVSEDDYTDVATTPRAADDAPNVIVIMVDDLDVRSLQDMLAAGLMPSLKRRIVDRAVEMTEAYVTTPVCCPSRATYLTGAYSHNTGIVNNRLWNPDRGLEDAVAQFDDSVTIATRLRALGYTTAHIGKYLHGYGSKPDLVYLSPAFDPHYIPPGWSDWSGLVDFYTYCVYDYKINRNGVLTRYFRPPGVTESTALYQTNVLADLAESFILAHRFDEAPFYLEVMPLAPHAERCADAYGGGPVPGDGDFGVRIRPAPEYASAAVPPFVPGPAYDEDVSDKPLWLSGTPPLTTGDFDDISAQYEQRERALLSVDRLLERVAAALGPRIDDTVLIFTSDNGWLFGDHRVGGKVYAYQESVRVPLYIALPGSTRASTRANLVLNNDLTPSILDLVAPGYTDTGFDGRSIVPLLLQPDPPDWRDRSLFLIEYSRSVLDPGQDSYPTYQALRSRDTLYVESYGGLYYRGANELLGVERYDLVRDPHELSSLLHYPENGRDPILAPRLDLLVNCAGSDCREYEDLTIMP